jgi:hypothetical protein
LSKGSKVSIEELFQIAGQLAVSELVCAIVFEKSTDPRLPGGLYCKARVASAHERKARKEGDWGRPWKIDIWSLDGSVIYDLMQDMEGFKEKMTPEIDHQLHSLHSLHNDREAPHAYVQRILHIQSVY